MHLLFVRSNHSHGPKKHTAPIKHNCIWPPPLFQTHQSTLLSVGLFPPPSSGRQHRWHLNWVLLNGTTSPCCSFLQVKMDGWMLHVNITVPGGLLKRKKNSWRWKIKKQRQTQKREIKYQNDGPWWWNSAIILWQVSTTLGFIQNKQVGNDNH